MDKELIKLLVDTGKKSVEKFSVDKGNQAVRKALIDLCGTDMPDYRTFRRNKNEIFEIVEIALDEVITSGWANNDFFNSLVEYKNVRLGDKNEFTAPDNSILTVSRIARGNLDLKSQRLDSGSSFNVPVSTYGVKVGESLLRVISGRMDWSALVAKVQQAYDLKLKDSIYASVKGSIAYLPAEFKSTGSYLPADLQAICDHTSSANGNAPVIIAGTATALGNVYGTADITWSDGMKDEFNRTGRVAFWRGKPLIELPQFHKINSFTFGLDDTQLFILPSGAHPIKVVEEGQAIIVDNPDGENKLDMSIDYTMIKEYGISCIFNELYGMYDLA